MGISVPILAIAISLHLIAFVLAVGAERRRSTVLYSSISMNSFLNLIYFNLFFLAAIDLIWFRFFLCLWRRRWSQMSTTRERTARTTPTRRRCTGWRRLDCCWLRRRWFTALPSVSASGEGWWAAAALLLARSSSLFSHGEFTPCSFCSCLIYHFYHFCCCRCASLWILLWLSNEFEFGANSVVCSNCRKNWHLFYLAPEIVASFC